MLFFILYSDFSQIITPFVQQLQDSVRLQLKVQGTLDVCAKFLAY